MKKLDISAAAEEFYREFPDHKDTTVILDRSEFPSSRAAIASFEDRVDEHIGGVIKHVAENGNFLQRKLVQRDGVEESLKAFFEFQLEAIFTSSLAHAVPLSLKLGQKEYESGFRVICPAVPDTTVDTLLEKFRTPAFIQMGIADAFEWESTVMTHLKGVPEELDDAEMWQRFVLDHELGHAVTMRGTDRSLAVDHDFTNLLECMADSYALIRHYQRYGEDSGFGEYLASLRTTAAIYQGDIGHYSTEAIETVIALNKDGKLADLTPEQSRDLAVEIGHKSFHDLNAKHAFEDAFWSRKVTEMFGAATDKSWDVKGALTEAWKKRSLSDAVDRVRNEWKFDGKDALRDLLLPVEKHLKQPDDAIAWVAEKGSTTESKLVHTVATRFLERAADIFVDGSYDADALKAAREKVAAHAPDETEPERPIVGRMFHKLRTRGLKNLK